MLNFYRIFSYIYLDPTVIYSSPVHIWNPALPEICWFSQTNKKLHKGMGLSISLCKIISLRTWGIESVHTSEGILKIKFELSLLSFLSFQNFSFISALHSDVRVSS